jgi:SSS family solute:Na+ symporter
MAGVGLFSGRKVKSSSDFSVGGRRAGPTIVAGTIMGTLVGGASTVGTAQLAFQVGLSAWWFTLGAGLGCLALALFFAVPVRRSGAETVSQIVASEYGPLSKTVSGISLSLGIFLNVVAQILAGVALLKSLFGMGPGAAAAATALCMGSFVISGGLWGAGASGTAKTFILYISVALGGAIGYSLSGGVSGLRASFPAFPWFSLFGRGFATDASAGFSLLVGVLSTQTYLQALLSAKDDRSAVRGSLIGAFLIPPIGLAGVVIGLFMRMNHPGIDPASAFPAFVLAYVPAWLGGVVLASLFIAVLGTGSGLALGIGVILSKDFYALRRGRRGEKPKDKDVLRFSRISIAVVLAFAALFSTGNIKSLILQWSFLSMGLRGAAILAPLIGALFLKNKIGKAWALASMASGPAAMIVWKILLPRGLDPLVPGVGVSFGLMALGYLIKAGFKPRNPS